MNIFVARLNYQTDDDSLRDLFEGYGEVSSAKVVMDRETGRSRGFGFVDMPNEEEAKAAIEDLNETDFDERTIVVKEANPSETGSGDRSGGGRGGYGGGGYRGGGGGYGGGGYNRGGGENSEESSDSHY
ncbi:MAG: RNA-binding protein [Bacteroidia bacterium]|nr:RNA-binding protein [Bacteroidia bacterium]NNF31664.1 RNA-binding protein [Flavobacteriaceae bacterium]MBT8276720.1 RNA-binding protein [Bacteroidia bacterium]NNJ82826.1 RNA-binding protein [Flavobacteriaceae bacterium]NNK55178.1 RNA-binding protein [Flavobacteriaceae bacterium]